jgi:hypothetical protein
MALMLFGSVGLVTAVAGVLGGVLSAARADERRLRTRSTRSAPTRCNSAAPSARYHESEGGADGWHRSRRRCPPTWGYPPTSGPVDGTGITPTSSSPALQAATDDTSNASMARGPVTPIRYPLPPAANGFVGSVRELSGALVGGPVGGRTAR